MKVAVTAMLGALLAVRVATSLAAEIRVGSLTALEEAIAAANAGDQIVVENGRYDVSDAITIDRAGTEEKPIAVSAESVGGVEIAGEAGFAVVPPAAYVVIRGFVFTHEAGEMRIEPGVHHCRVTRNAFELEVRRRARYLAVLGDDVEIDHNVFRFKDTEGQMLHVEGPGDSAMAQRTWIHHNLFHDFRRSRRNNSSALHIGHSARSMTSAWSVVEHNVFLRTEGENEGAICNKSSDNVYRFNTLGEGSSELSLRHGKRCLVYGNFFRGGNGIRFYSHDHRIFSNYFEDCRPAINIGNGGATIPPGELTSHERPERVMVVHNTLVDNRVNVQMDRRRRGLGAHDLVFANNIIVGGGPAAKIDGPLVRPKWEGNILWNNDGGPGDMPENGYTEADPGLEDGNGTRHKIRDESTAAGNAVGAYPFVAIDLEGQKIETAREVGADQLVDGPVANRLLSPADVGPGAPEEDRPLISEPSKVEWISPHDVTAAAR